MSLSIIVLESAQHKIIGELACLHARASGHSATLVHTEKSLQDELASGHYSLAIISDSLGETSQVPEDIAANVRQQHPEMPLLLLKSGIEDPSRAELPFEYAIPKNMHWLDYIFSNA